MNFHAIYLQWEYLISAQQKSEPKPNHNNNLHKNSTIQYTATDHSRIRNVTAIESNTETTSQHNHNQRSFSIIAYFSDIIPFSVLIVFVQFVFSMNMNTRTTTRTTKAYNNISRRNLAHFHQGLSDSLQFGPTFAHLRHWT